MPVLLNRFDVLNSAPASHWREAERANIESDTRGILIQLNNSEEGLKVDSYPTDLNVMLVHDFSSSAPHTQDPTTPMAIAYHRTAKILCLYILSWFHGSLQEELHNNCTDILESAQGLFNGGMLHPSYWRHILLLKVIAFAAPRNSLKEGAQTILDDWARKTGLCGIKMGGQVSAWDVDIASF